MAYVYLVSQYEGSAMDRPEKDAKQDSDVGGIGRVVSTFQDPIGWDILLITFMQIYLQVHGDRGGELGDWGESEAIFSAVVEGSVEKVEDCIDKGADVNMRSKEVFL